MGLTVSCAPALLLESDPTKTTRLGTYDLIILGGGCAGLSLAMRLAALGEKCPRTLILEKRFEYVNDRTWCFWGESSLPVRHLVNHSWNIVTLRHADRNVRVDCSKAPYQMISGSDFYAAAFKAIQESNRIELVTGVALLYEPQSTDNYWQVETDEGTFAGATVVDTRPSRLPETGQAVLWQSFSGYEIECDSPIFDPSSADLMHFADGHLGRVEFNYVLPLSRHHALMEATVFGAEPATHQQLLTRLRESLEQRLKGKAFRTIRTEHGILPMGSASARKAADPTYIRAGLTAGGARTSTGYAFQRIQRWADECAHAMSQARLPIAHPSDPVLLQSLDYLFISVLRTHPELAPDLFLSLFEKTTPDRMIRFLSDCGTIQDYAMVAAALPVMPFIQEIPNAIGRKISQWRGRRV